MAQTQVWYCPYCDSKIQTVMDPDRYRGDIVKCQHCKRNVPFTPADVTPMYNESTDVAVLIFGATPTDARVLREALGPQTSRRWDVSDWNFPQIRRLHDMLTEVRRYRVVVYTRDAALRNGAITESRIMRMTTMRRLQEELARDLVHVCVPTAHDAVTAVRDHFARRFGSSLVSEEGVPKPKQPTDVDRMKVQQKQETLSLKQRQQNDLLQAKKRELDAQSREDAEKITNGTKPRDITR